jgi:methylated-DNA-[protein]-cysteine S-methyltransferase
MKMKMNLNEGGGRTPGEAVAANEKRSAIIKSPVGELMLVATGSALTGLYFIDPGHLPADAKGWRTDEGHPVLREAAKQLAEYFAGARSAFTVPLRPTGTPFQEKIWREIVRIPYGGTLSYSELAERAGAARAIRAAGSSTGRNPIAIIIPCHRVVGKNGGLGGFGGGLERKRRLLALEGGAFELLNRYSGSNRAATTVTSSLPRSKSR